MTAIVPAGSARVYSPPVGSASMKPEFLGDWYLDGHALVEAGAGPGGPPDPADVENWLLAAAGVGWPEVEARSGLELTIRRDESYSERVIGGRRSMLWYDSEGVQTDSPEPTEGTVREVNGRATVSLHPRGAQLRSVPIQRAFETSCVMMTATRRLATFSRSLASRSFGLSRS